MDERRKAIFWSVMYCVMLVFGVIVFNSPPFAKADAESLSYTSVLEDLSKDDNFAVSEYPEDQTDLSLTVIQIAESVNGELFVYVYSPSSRAATSLNITQERGTGIENRLLSPIDVKGVFGKYRVSGIKLRTDQTRYYEIVSIYRAWDGDVDDKPAGDNTVTEVSYEVGKRYTATTDENGRVTYDCEKFGVITVTEKFVGFLRYRNTLGESTDAHFVAFDTDLPIENLYAADISYIVQRESNVDVDKFYPARKESKTITAEQTGENDPFLFHKKYTWKRIGKAEELARNEDLSAAAKKQLENKQWVLYFLETEYSSWQSVSTGIMLFDKYNVNEVTILRLNYETAGTVYNLGVVDNKQTGSETPVNRISNLGLYLCAIAFSGILVGVVIAVVKKV